MRRFSSIALRALFVSSIFIFKSSVTLGQYEELINYRIEIIEGMVSAEEGTFQILIDPKYKPVFTIELGYFIESKRKQDEDVWIKLMPCAEVYIPSRQKINSPDFIPLAVTAN